MVYMTAPQERPVTKEVVTYVQENHPVAKQVRSYHTDMMSVNVLLSPEAYQCC